MKIDTEEIKKDFCQSFCVMYSGEDYECGKGGLCPFKGKITHQKEIEEERNKKIFHLVTKDLKFIDPEEEEFRANNILGIVVRYSHSAKAMKANIIKDIIERYRLKSNINFGNAFWTSSTGYDKYICGLGLGSNGVVCGCGRDRSCSVLPFLAILEA